MPVSIPPYFVLYRACLTRQALVDNDLQICWRGYNARMAKNNSKGRGRKGEVSKRSQVLSGRNKRWTKVNNKTGRFMDQMARKGKAFKGVRMK